jgi:hypothetical protein
MAFAVVPILLVFALIVYGVATSANRRMKPGNRNVRIGECPQSELQHHREAGQHKLLETPIPTTNIATTAIGWVLVMASSSTTAAAQAFAVDQSLWVFLNQRCDD